MKMINKKVVGKLFAVLFTCSIFTVSMTGCGRDNVEKDTTQSEKNSETGISDGEFDPRTITEGVKLTIAVADNPSIIDFETNQMTEMIEEALGVDLEFEVLPSADYQDKLNVMVMSGEELPDMIFFGAGTSLDVINRWVDEGAVLELSEYYENPDYTKHIAADLEKVDKDVIKYLRDAEGNVYALPVYDQVIGDQWNKLWIYKPWLDEIGKDVPETTDEFLEVCRLIAGKDFNGNGKPDEIPLTGAGLDYLGGAWFRYLMSPYVYSHSSNYRFIEDGKVQLAYTTDEWKEGLKYIKQFFDEGLIPGETLTQDWTQFTSLLYAEEQTLFGFNWFYYDGEDVERGSNYVCIPSLKGPDGVERPMMEEGMPSLGGIITTDCENPEAAFLVADYMCKEEIGISQHSGEQGVDWDYWEDANVENKEDYKASYPGNDIYFIRYNNDAFWAERASKPQNKSFLQNGPFILPDMVTLGLAMEANAGDQETEYKNIINDAYYAAQLDTLQKAPEESATFIPLSAEENEQIADILTNLSIYVEESTAKFLTGAMDIDEDWDAYLGELEKIGYKTVIDVYQTGYDRLGI